MSKPGKEPSVKGNNNSVRAGKKKSYTAPPPPNEEKQLARKLGEKQFQSPVVLTVPATKLVIDKKTGKTITKVYDAPVSFLWDEHRRQFVYSPTEESK